MESRVSAYETLLNMLPDRDESSMTNEELDREWLLSINDGSRGKISSKEIHTILPPPPRFTAIAQQFSLFFFAG